MIPLLLFLLVKEFPPNKPSKRFFRSGDICTIARKRNNYYYGGRVIGPSPGLRELREGGRARPLAPTLTAPAPALPSWLSGLKEGSTVERAVRASTRSGAEGRGGATHLLHRVCAGTMTDGF